jgi:hypothetical protein
VTDGPQIRRMVLRVTAAKSWPFPGVNADGRKANRRGREGPVSAEKGRTLVFLSRRKYVGAPFEWQPVHVGETRLDETGRHRSCSLALYLATHCRRRELLDSERRLQRCKNHLWWRK